MARFDAKDMAALNALSEDQLRTFIVKKCIQQKRELEKRVMVEKQQSICLHNFMEYVSSHSGNYNSSQQQIIEEIEGIDKQIEVKAKERDALKTQIDNLQKPYKEALHEKIKAQNEITKKRIRSIFKYFEKSSEDFPVRMMETFIATLRNRDPAEIGPQDVELYLSKHQGLIVACNKLDATKIDRTVTMKYLEILKDLNEEIKNSKYAKFVPFYCFVDAVCRMVKIGVEIRQIEAEQKTFDDEIAEYEVQKDKKKMILAFMNCDPESDADNAKLHKEWANETENLFKGLDIDMAKVKNFESQFIGGMR